MTQRERVVAIGLLTARELDMLGSGFRRAFPIDDDNCFDELLRAIDEAERERTGQRDEPH